MNFLILQCLKLTGAFSDSPVLSPLRGHHSGFYRLNHAYHIVIANALWFLVFYLYIYYYCCFCCFFSHILWASYNGIRVVSTTLWSLLLSIILFDQLNKQYFCFICFQMQIIGFNISKRSSDERTKHIRELSFNWKNWGHEGRRFQRN